MGKAGGEQAALEKRWKTMRLWLKENGVWKYFKKVKPGDLKSRNIEISDSAIVGEGARICDGAIVGDRARIGEGARICDRAAVGNRAIVGDRAMICDGAIVGDRATVGKGATVGYWAIVGKGAKVGDGATVGYWAIVGDRAMICDGAIVGDRARIGKTADCIVLGPIGSRDAMLTGYFHEGEVWCATGCFCATMEKFEKEVKRVHVGTIHEADYLAACDYIRKRIGLAQKVGGK